MKLLIAIASLFLTSASASASDRCSGFLGKTMHPQSFSQVVEALGDMSPKGEFESTAHYNERIHQGPREMQIISKYSMPEYFEYDADNGELMVKEWAFSFPGMNFKTAFRVTRAPVSTGDFNIGLTVTKDDVPVGTSNGQNGFGATATIKQIHRVTDAIFDRPAKGYVIGSGQTFPTDSNNFVGRISLSPEDAKRLKPALRVVVGVLLREPYLVQGEQEAVSPTLSNPVEIMETFRVLIATIACGFITDDQNIVLSVYDSGREDQVPVIGGTGSVAVNSPSAPRSNPPAAVSRRPR